MIRKALLFAVLGAMASCAPNPGPLSIASFREVDFSVCAAQSDSAHKQLGLINISGNPDYWVTVEVAGTDSLQVPPTQGGGGLELEPANRERFIIDQMVFSYAARPPIGGLPARETVNVSVALVNGENFILANLIGPELSAVLGSGAIPVSPLFEDKTTLTVTTELRGHLTGAGAAFTTGPYPYDIWLINTPDPACTSGQYARESGCFSTGQDTATRTNCCGATATADGGVPSGFGCP